MGSLETYVSHRKNKQDIKEVDEQQEKLLREHRELKKRPCDPSTELQMILMTFENMCAYIFAIEFILVTSYRLENTIYWLL